jgi:hypothetical protein
MDIKRVGTKADMPSVEAVSSNFQRDYFPKHSLFLLFQSMKEIAIWIYPLRFTVFLNFVHRLEF